MGAWGGNFLTTVFGSTIQNMPTATISAVYESGVCIYILHNSVKLCNLLCPCTKLDCKVNLASCVHWFLNFSVYFSVLVRTHLLPRSWHETVHGCTSRKGGRGTYETAVFTELLWTAVSLIRAEISHCCSCMHGSFVAHLISMIAGKEDIFYCIISFPDHWHWPLVWEWDYVSIFILFFP